MHTDVADPVHKAHTIEQSWVFRVGDVAVC